MKRVAWLLFGALWVAALVGCGVGGGEGISIEDPWVRPALIEHGNGAGFMVIRNGGPDDDALLSVRASIAGMVEIHQTMRQEDEVMSMQPVERIEIPAGSRVALEPGGYHVMFMNVEPTLEPGQRVLLTLVFEKAGEIQVEAEVRAE